MKLKAKFIFVMGVVAALLLIYCAYYKIGESKVIVYREHLSDQILTVDGTVLTLQDLAFYIAYEENLIEKQAMVYSPENTNQYWNLHIEGNFIKLAAKQAVIDMAVHDKIFYELALANNLSLSAEDREQLAGTQSDFWMDLTEEQKELLGVSQEILNDQMYQIALAEKYQKFQSEADDKNYNSYNMDGVAYEQILAEHTYVLEEELWRRVNFGNIILSH